MTPEERADHAARRREDNTLIAAHRTDEHNDLVFICERCARSERFVTRINTELSQHLRDVHGIDNVRPARRTNAIHTDADRWYGETEYWALDGAPLFIAARRWPR